MNDLNRFRFPGKNFLLVEDIIDNQDLIKDIAEIMLFNLDIASNGDEAIKKFKENKYDLIIMDIQMPKKDGYQTTKEIRELEDGNNLTPILALTASALAEDRKKCLEIGMNDYLSKPITFALFGEKVSGLLRKKLDASGL